MIKTKKLLNTRKAQIGATLTWVVAFLIIFFIMLLFVSATAFLTGKKFLFGEEGNIIGIEGGLGTQKTQRIMMRFLNTPIGLGDEEISIHDLILSSDLDNEEASKIFNENANEIFLDKFPFPYADWKGVHPWWIRVYNVNDEVKSTDRLAKKNFHAGTWNCNPNNFEENIVNTIIVGDKKVIFCILKSYYNLK